MGRVRRPPMSAREKVELWKRWKRGESLSDIGRALGRIPGAVHHVVSARGGIPPPSRTRSRRSLTLTEREEISRGLARGYSVRQIGVRLSRAPSTISREPGGATERWPTAVPCVRCRRACLGPSSASETLSARPLAVALCPGG